MADADGHAFAIVVWLSVESALTNETLIKFGWQFEDREMSLASRSTSGVSECLGFSSILRDFWVPRFSTVAWVFDKSRKTKLKRGVAAVCP